MVTEDRQLRRLETLMDVVYGITIWRLFMLLPRPAGEELELHTIGELFKDSGQSFAGIFIGIVIVIIYWKQNNMLFKHLERTDSFHTTISILQIFALLFFLYAMGISVRFEGLTGARLLESITAMLVGITSYLGWRHAVKKNLNSAALPGSDAKKISFRILAEPITAAITIPFAFQTPILWELAWFVYPLVQKGLRKLIVAP
ncbi:MAG: hypothetical protein LJE74_02975 [Proteobacteria bacterium]|jgi:uncharacterized membrane protein|nr:hypothetical protein [Pseudomonadota bacterium]MCG6934743.1 hypothetical protein [Pseudomonadota bacterium]